MQNLLQIVFFSTFFNNKHRYINNKNQLITFIQINYFVKDRFSKIK